MLIDYQAVVGLISRVAAPGNHVDQAIELITERRDEAHTIAKRELEQLTEDEQEQFKLAVARHVWAAMVVAADMLARSGNLMRAPRRLRPPARRGRRRRRHAHNERAAQGRNRAPQGRRVVRGILN
jgi:hypothetical protein